MILPQIFKDELVYLGIIAVSVALPAPVCAQNNTSAVSQAKDAFGQRVGNEEIGIYSESLVRGFSLENAGNYRIDGHYYVRSSKLPDVVLSGVSIEVGTNALSGNFPAPSGIVASKLSKAGEGSASLTVETGIRAQFQPFVEAKSWLANSSSSLSMSGGILISPHITFADGTQGSEFAAGVVPRASVGNVELTGVAAWSQRTFNGNYGFKNERDGLPEKLHGNHLLAPEWQDYKNVTWNLGGMAKWKQSQWEGAASVIWSANELPISGFTMLTFRKSGLVHAIASSARDQFTRSLSSEASLARRFSAFGLEQKITGGIRYRRSTTSNTPGVSIDLGLIELDQREYGPPPEWDYDVVNSTGLITQKSIGLSYDLNVHNLFQIQAGGQRILYKKRVHTEDLPPDQTSNNYLVYNASILIPVHKNWVAFAAYTRGLEEKGTAPNNAINRNEVLPAVIASQIELGFRGRISQKIVLAGALFQVSKPTTGFDYYGYFGLQGDVRHRGAELSLSGPITNDLTIAAGAVYLKPENLGLTGTDGTVSSWPMGQSKLTGQINAEQRIPVLQGLSVDGQINYQSPRPADWLNTHQTQPIVLVDIGSRYRFTMSGKPTVVRLRLQNAFNIRAWNASPSGTISRLRSRVVTLSIQSTI